MQTQAESIETALNTFFPYKIASGSGSVTIGSAVASATATVTLPAGFTLPPVITVQNTTNGAGRSLMLNFYVYSISATQFTLKLATADAANTGTSYTISYNWTAVQQTA
ncbi:hypothetical protein [Arthrobacter sp. NPDC056493]|uniref:hypothetical protein n=1 Tax=Arthrobacter sp. NPDC056493 TaxID=3345839 RepID=UPI003672605C